MSGEEDQKKRIEKAIRFFEADLEMQKPAWNSELYIDEADRKTLESMDDVERQKVLTERYELWRSYMEKEKTFKRLREEKGDAYFLEKLEEKKKSNELANMIHENSDDSGSDSLSSGSSGSSDSSSSDDEKEQNKGSPSKKDSVEMDSGPPVDESQVFVSTQSVEDVCKVQLTRSLAIRLMGLPDEVRNSAFTGCLVRVPTLQNRVYVLGQVVGTVQGEEEKVAGSVAPIRTRLKVRFPSGLGPDQSADMEMTEDGPCLTLCVGTLSNSALESSELETWKREEMPDKVEQLFVDLNRKTRQLTKAKNFKWNDEAIEEKLQRKLAKGEAKPVNVSVEAASLKTKLESLLMKQREMPKDVSRVSVSKVSELRVEISTIQKRLAEIQEMQQAEREKFTSGNKRTYGIVSINERNRRDQRLRDQQFSRLSAQKKKPSEKENLYRRRECQPAMMWDVGGGGHSEREKGLIDLQDEIDEDAISYMEKKRRFAHLAELLDLDVDPRDLLSALQRGADLSASSNLELDKYLRKPKVQCARDTHRLSQLYEGNPGSSREALPLWRNHIVSLLGGEDAQLGKVYTLDSYMERFEAHRRGNDGQEGGEELAPEE